MSNLNMQTQSTEEKGEYVKKRNSLIPLAQKEADEKHGAICLSTKEEEREAWAGKWNYTFHSAMKKLWKETLLREKENDCQST